MIRLLWSPQVHWPSQFCLGAVKVRTLARIGPLYLLRLSHEMPSDGG